jgi:hypothetical protein
MENQQYFIFYSKIMKEIAFIVLLFPNIIFSAVLSTNLQKLGLKNEAVFDLLRPFFISNPTIESKLTENGSLDMETEFQPLFQFLFSDSSASALVLPRFQEIGPLKWSANMNSTDLMITLTKMLTNSLPLFYRMLTDSSFLQNEAECQQWLLAILSTNNEPAAEKVLAPITGDFFWNKRCILSQEPNLLEIV